MKLTLYKTIFNSFIQSISGYLSCHFEINVAQLPIWDTPPWTIKIKTGKIKLVDMTPDLSVNYQGFHLNRSLSVPLTRFYMSSVFQDHC